MTSAGVVGDVGDDAADGACGEDAADDDPVEEPTVANDAGADVEAGVSPEVAARSPQASSMELTNANLANFTIPTRSSISCASAPCMVVAALEKVTVVVTAHEATKMTRPVGLLRTIGDRWPSHLNV